jgi:c(7)-type cytochrome triheme protein
MKKIILMVVIALGIAGIAFAQTGVKKKRPQPYDFGRVTINNYSAKLGLAPVQFDHWVHRGKYTCRLCHMDLGFGMKTGDTQIKAADNIRGYYCGACHNGKMTYGDKVIFAACSREYSKEDVKRCERCHVTTPNSKREIEFEKFAEKLPKERYGNGINWEKAEELGLIKPIDFIEGISIKRANLATQKDFALEAKVDGMPDIIFSHKKHTVWNGCEVCHPDIFVGIKKGANKYSMAEIFQGRYCGACHVSVAFPTTDCQRCHTRPVR